MDCLRASAEGTGILAGWTDLSGGRITVYDHHCPGHTPGHVVLFEPKEEKFLWETFSSPVQLADDLPGGSTEQLMDSITNKLLPLGDDVEVYSVMDQ